MSHAELIIRACRQIEAAEAPPSLAALAQAAGLSPHHFQRLFKAHTGVTPRAYAEGQRARRLRARLTQAASVTEAIYDAGFNAPSRFYENARELIGMTPSRWRAGGAGETIRFALGQCSLGAILVAESDQGICSIALGDAPEPLLAQLQAQFPRADLVGGDAAFERRVAQVVGFVEQPQRLPAARVAGAARGAGRPDAELRRAGAPHRPAARRPRRGARLRQQRAGRGHPLPPRGARRRRAGRLSLGRGAQAGAARK